MDNDSLHSRTPTISVRHARARLRQLRARIDARNQRELNDIDEALRRIADGTYGTCVSCQQAISSERLRTMPEASRCIRCEAKHESSPGHAKLPLHSP